VMNTDNMTISGETIDYGPCAFLDNYAPGTVFSSIDRQGRYAFGNQPAVLGWNLARLAETLIPLIPGGDDAAVDALNVRLEAIAVAFRVAHLAVMRAKLGLEGTDAADGALVGELLAAMVGSDWTLTFRRLADDGAGLSPAVAALLPRLAARGADKARMRAANPLVIPRNHLVEEALSAADAGDIAPFKAFLLAVQHPFETPSAVRYALPPPDGFGDYVTYCGT